MTYTFTTDVTAEEIEKFLAALPHYNVMQSPAWAQVKPDWSSILCGVRDENGTLCGSALLLIRRLPLGFKIAYSPRGFIADYSNEASLFRGFAITAKRSGHTSCELIQRYA